MAGLAARAVVTILLAVAGQVERQIAHELVLEHLGVDQLMAPRLAPVQLSSSSSRPWIDRNPLSQGRFGASTAVSCVCVTVK
jgi:hypothetical protein